MKRSTSMVATGALALAFTLAVSGCDDDETSVWDESIASPIRAIGLEGSAALIDAPANRVLMLAVEDDQVLVPHSIPVAEGIAAAAATPDAARLLVLSHGVVPRREALDAGPSLSVLDGSNEPGLVATYRLSDPLSGLVIDPQSRFAVVHASESDVAFVQNPNELVVVDLSRGPAADNPGPSTLRSFGGRPEAFTFTPELALPGGPRRLLVVATDRDVALLDLADRSIPEVTIRLTSDATPSHPAGIAVSDGATDRDDDARIAVRLAGEPDVVIIDLVPVPADEAATTPQTFRAVPNVVFVGGAPSDIAFVETDGGLRLAALVPSRNALALLDPATGIATDVDLGAPFEKLTLVTDVVGDDGSGGDVALLWSSSSPQIAFVALGGAVGAPYRSVERLQLADPVSEVVPIAAPNEHLRVLVGQDGDELTVLDLLARTASPLVASAGGARIARAPDGQRAWIFSPNQASIAQLDFATLHPRNITLSHGVFEAFDVSRRGGGRAVIAVHDVGARAVTVLDGLAPSATTARDYAGLLLGGLK